MIIYDHAVNNYVKRVLKLPKENVENAIKEFAKEQIEKAYNEPEQVLNIDQDMPPLYVRNGAAVVVANNKKQVNGDTIYTYIEDGGEVIIPTVYDLETYADKYDINEHILEKSKQEGIS